MKKVLSKILDDENKKPKWWNRNWFFISTVVVIFINLMIFLIDNDWYSKFLKVSEHGGHWRDAFYFVPTWRSFFSSFSHMNAEHIGLNMLCFFVAGAYLERKFGSIGLFLTVIIGAYLSAVAINSNDLSGGGVGFSGVNYFLYAVVLVDYIFTFITRRRNKITTIAGAVVLALIYIAMCFNEDAQGFPFTWYPHDLIYNLAHYSSFFMGLVCTLALKLVQLKTRWETAKELNEKISEDKKDNNGADNV